MSKITLSSGPISEDALAELHARAQQAGRGTLCFDWLRAAQILRTAQADAAEAGLAEDWLATSTLIAKDGRPVISKGRPWLSSCWATPVLVLYRGEAQEIVECYITAEEWQARRKEGLFYITDSDRFEPTETWPTEAMCALKA